MTIVAATLGYWGDGDGGSRRRFGWIGGAAAGGCRRLMVVCSKRVCDYTHLVFALFRFRVE